MLWLLNQHGKVSIFQIYIGNTNRASILSIYRSFLSSWSNLTGDEVPALKSLAKKKNPALLGFIIADEFIKSHNTLKHIYNNIYLDYLEILNLIPKDWQNKINTTLTNQGTIKEVMVTSS